MKIKSYAKINLCLDVLKKSGKFHAIRTVLRQIDLYDEIIIKKIPGGKIKISYDDPAGPCGPKNTAYRAAHLLRKYAAAIKPKSARVKNPPGNRICGVEIFIKKNIPVASGLGGGSGNGAAVLRALNKLWGLNLPKMALLDLAAKIGMDTPFFIDGGTALGTHYGEKITPLPDFPLPPYLIAMCGKKSGTGNVYGLLNLNKTAKKTGLTTQLIQSLKTKKKIHPGNFFHNDFETALKNKPKDKKMAGTKKLFGLLLQTGADVVHLCGSGPAVYAFYKSIKERDAATEKLHGKLRGNIAFIRPGP